VVAFARCRTAPHTAADDPVDDLADVAAAGRAAFAALYAAYFAPIYRYCYVRLGTPERAEDAAHQVFVRALAAFGRYKETGRAREWLFAIAHNVVVDEVRRRPPVPLALLEQEAAPDPSPEELALDDDAQRALRQAVAALPAAQRQAIELRIAGLTGQEAAHALGRSHEAIKMLQHRAIDRLRTALAVNEAGGRHEA
jgi:RNA polymerase sigma-70 factor (ECF subfamily)